MRIDHTHTGRPCNGAPAVDRRHDDSALPIRAQATGSRHLPVPASGRPRSGRSRDLFRVYSEDDFARLLEGQPQVGWTSQSALGADTPAAGRRRSRAVATGVAAWQGVGLLSAAAMLGGAAGAAAALVLAASHRQLAASQRRPGGVFPIGHAATASARTPAVMIVARASRPGRRTRPDRRDRGRPSAGASMRAFEARSRAQRVTASDVPARRVRRPTVLATRASRSSVVQAARAASPPPSPARPAAARRTTGVSAPSRPADFTFER